MIRSRSCVARYEQLGPIFSIRLGPRRAAVLLGSENQRFFLTQTGKTLSLRESVKWMIPIVGNDFPTVTEDQRHRELFPVYKLPFHESRMDGYVGIMAHHAHRWLDTLGQQGEFELVDVVSSLLLSIAASTILGDEVRERAGHRLPILFRDLTPDPKPTAGPHTNRPRSPVIVQYRKRSPRSLRLCFVEPSSG